LIIAHSSVAQMGYLLMVFPLLVSANGAAAGADGAAAVWLTPAWSAAVFQVVSHAFAKAALFLAAGVILFSVGHDRHDSLFDLVARRPATALAVGLAGVSLIGLPPSGGFFAKWMLLKSVFLSGQWWWAPAVLLGSLLTAGYVFMVLRLAYAPGGRKTDCGPVPASMEFIALILAIGSFAVVLPAEAVIEYLQISAVPGLAANEGGGAGQ
jgi:multicomponent Na+:H+ antiporter subunit D